MVSEKSILKMRANNLFKSLTLFPEVHWSVVPSLQDAQIPGINRDSVLQQDPQPYSCHETGSCSTGVTIFAVTLGWTLSIWSRV